MSKRVKSTAVASEVVEVTPVTETTVETPTPEQTSIDDMIESTIETKLQDKPAFVSKLCVITETLNSRKNNSDPTRQYQVIINGKQVGTANSYRFTQATEKYPTVQYNNFSPVWMYLDNTDGTQIKKEFKSQKRDDGTWLRGIDAATAYVRRLGAYMLNHPEYVIQQEVIAE